MMMRTVGIALFMLLHVGCASNEKATVSEIKEPSPQKAETPKLGVTDDALNRFRRSIKGKGLIVLNDNYQKPGDLIRFYNEDGSIWYEFTFYYDDSDGDFEYKNENFGPFSFHPDYFTLALSVTSEDATGYMVIVNENTGLKKYVKKADGNLKFETWEAHLLETFAIEFDKANNPIRQTPKGELKTVDFEKIARISAASFDGDWLKIEWDASGSDHDEDKPKDSGWIRWRDGDVLLIDWFYFA